MFLPDLDRPFASRPYLVPSIFLTCIFGSLLPPKIRTATVLILSLYLLFQIPKYTYGKPHEDYLFPIQALLVITHWIDFFLVHSPDEFSREKDGEHRPKTLWDKFKWVWDLNLTLRGIGWNWQVKYVREGCPADTTRWEFAGKEIGKTILFYLFFDLTVFITRASAYGSPSIPDLFSDSLLRQVFFAWLPAVGTYYSMNMQISGFSAVTVLSGIYTPQDWPPLMGRPRDVSTIRGLWGKFWHQFLRRTLGIPFDILTKVIPIKHGTLLSRYLQLGLAFLTSGCIHQFGALNLPSSSTENNRKQFTFFIVQPLAIIFEDLVIYVGNGRGIKRSGRTKALGQLWVFLWFSWSLRYMVAFVYSSRAMATKQMPSLIDSMIRILSRSEPSGNHQL